MRRAGALHDGLHEPSVASTSAFDASNKSASCTCNSMRPHNFSLASAAGIRAIARLMISAAEPCSGALTASRSALAWRAGLASLRRSNVASLARRHQPAAESPVGSVTSQS
jgi:hypothetical protein